MSRSMNRIPLLASAALVALAAVAGAQQPAPRPAQRDTMHHDMPGRMPRDMAHDMAAMHRMGPQARAHHPGGVAAMLLGQTAALKLTDQQVTRLAALARSAESQETANRASMDSVHRAMAPARDGAPMRMTPAMEARMKAVHDQMHANVRDALAVLTPDQLATAWQLRGGPGGMGMGGMGMMDGRKMRMRQPTPRMAPSRTPQPQ